jgi:hypothetical protein
MSAGGSSETAVDPTSSIFLKQGVSAIVKKPFPHAWLQVLGSARLSYLATAAIADGMAVPHLSLMVMSFLESDPKLDACFVFSTRRDTQKFRNLLSNHRVSIMCHDFANPEARGTLSITCYGTVVVLSGEEEERIRSAHLQRNPSYAQFIAGEHIAICVVSPDIAQSCGENDRVESWKKPSESDEAKAAD